MMGNNNYKDLQVWQRSMTLCVQVYRITQAFPREEMFGLTSQMRRASVSIPSNIAEGQVRTSAAFANHLNIAVGSAAELETQLLIAQQIGYLDETNCKQLINEVVEIIQMLRGLLRSLK